MSSELLPEFPIVIRCRVLFTIVFGRQRGSDNSSLPIFFAATVSFCLSLFIDQLSLPFRFNMSLIVLERTWPRFISWPAFRRVLAYLTSTGLELSDGIGSFECPWLLPFVISARAVFLFPVPRSFFFSSFGIVSARWIMPHVVALPFLLGFLLRVVS